MNYPVWDSVKSNFQIILLWAGDSVFETYRKPILPSHYLNSTA